MRELLRQLVTALDAGQAVAFCQLVETRGSTPQKAGAAMLVRADGSQAGTLGGGCVEAEVKRRAMQNIERNAAAVEMFHLDHDFGWDDGLICGGRMQVHIDPLAPQGEHDYYRRLAQITASSQGATQAIVFDAKTSGCATGAALLFDGQGELIATRGNIAAEVLPAVALEALIPLHKRPQPYAQAGIAYLPLLPRCRLVIVGGGHVGQAVAELAQAVEFDVWVVDDRESIVSPERFPHAERRIAGPMDETLRQLEVTPDTFCLIVTRGHQHDERALFHLADRGARYVGLIGSRRKIRMIFEDLEAAGVPRAALDQVRAPVGIDIGSQTVSEIAISIVAELIARRNLSK